MLATFHQPAAIFTGTGHGAETGHQLAPYRRREMEMIAQGTGKHPRLPIQLVDKQRGVQHAHQRVISHKQPRSLRIHIFRPFQRCCEIAALQGGHPGHGSQGRGTEIFNGDLNIGHDYLSVCSLAASPGCASLAL